MPQDFDTQSDGQRSTVLRELAKLYDLPETLAMSAADRVAMAGAALELLRRSDHITTDYLELKTCLLRLCGLPTDLAFAPLLSSAVPPEELASYGVLRSDVFVKVCKELLDFCDCDEQFQAFRSRNLPLTFCLRYVLLVRFLRRVYRVDATAPDPLLTSRVIASAMLMALGEAHFVDTAQIKPEQFALYYALLNLGVVA